MKLITTTDTHYGHSSRTHRVHEKFLLRLKRKCEEENIDALLHAGDWISCEQHQLPRTWKMFREIFGPDFPILSVIGNHDIWNQEIFSTSIRQRVWAKLPGLTSYAAIKSQHEKWAKEYNIHLLEGNPYETDTVIIYGFNGWYYYFSSESSDANSIPRMHESSPLQPFLSWEATNEFGAVSEMAKYEKKKKILVSHMPPYTQELERLTERMCANPKMLPYIIKDFDVFCFGHTHFTTNKILEHGNSGCRFINAGTDWDQHSCGYDKPKYLIFEV